MNVICQYCGKPAQFVDSSRVYRKSYGMIYYCKPCNAWVGVHEGTKKPLGVLANAELRRWKKKAHFYFDRLWKSKLMSRKAAYKWLSGQLHKPVAQTHIGMFDVSDCKRVVEVVFKFWRDQP
ncbi:zinc-finger-containing protein [Sporomusa acidovorans]|uniref:Uncharacterized protein n=1 Tax=Sporomusa acidovorans (strain ATCC 49682 / DSM 3132 / Mol) TaxID=1123286 RepID=A0ABZ3J713_SPOA4|nr:zinc-finger-containing protein [Sporomusa acidovorans]OZC24180.1 hypothetical protein SPACI_01550 [Sporomusa acidovorans DSM 3132]SDF77845.1 Protein of unknown function [Sporomusa acidovorans]